MHPAVFEAVASLRGDIANEGVQHLELANSIQKEVIEPLSKLNDRNEKVQRIVSGPFQLYSSHACLSCFVWFQELILTVPPRVSKRRG